MNQILRFFLAFCMFLLVIGFTTTQAATAFLGSTIVYMIQALAILLFIIQFIESIFD